MASSLTDDAADALAAGIDASHTVREAPLKDFAPLDSDICELDEIYIYNYSGIKNSFTRRKVGGWVNISRFKSLISKDSYNQFDEDIQSFDNCLLMAGKRLQNENIGYWVPLKFARELASKYGIYEKLKPLLCFNRIGLVKHCGYQFWEMFVNLNIFLSIRVLRRFDDDRVNINQLCDIYELTKGKKKKKNIRRQFKKNYKGDIIDSNDHTLCGGKWVPLEVARDFAVRHGLSRILAPILNFEKDPGSLPEARISKIDAAIADSWKIYSKNHNTFKDFPDSFTIPVPKNKKKVSLKVLTEEVRINLKEKRLMERAFPVLRRKSDGWTNASNLITAACAIRISDLNDRSNEDPDMQVANELYYRDQLHTMPHEYISVPPTKSKSINGFWVPIISARELLKEFHLKSAGKLNALLNSKAFSSLEQDVGDEIDDVEIIQNIPTIKEIESINLEEGDESSGDDAINHRTRKKIMSSKQVINLDSSGDEKETNSSSDEDGDETENENARNGSVMKSKSLPPDDVDVKNTIITDSLENLGLIDLSESGSDSADSSGSDEASSYEDEDEDDDRNSTNSSQNELYHEVKDSQEKESNPSSSPQETLYTESEIIKLLQSSYKSLEIILNRFITDNDIKEILKIIGSLEKVPFMTRKMFFSSNIIIVLKKIPNSRSIRNANIPIKVEKLLEHFNHLRNEGGTAPPNVTPARRNPELIQKQVPEINPPERRQSSSKPPPLKSPTPVVIVPVSSTATTDPRLKKRPAEDATDNRSKRPTPSIEVPPINVPAVPLRREKSREPSRDPREKSNELTREPSRDPREKSRELIRDYKESANKSIRDTVLPKKETSKIYPKEPSREPTNECSREQIMNVKTREPLREPSGLPASLPIIPDQPRAHSRDPRLASKQDKTSHSLALVPANPVPVVEEEAGYESESSTSVVSDVPYEDDITNDRLGRYRMLARFETGTKVDLIKRARILFGDKNNGIIFAERMFAFLDEKEIVRSNATASLL